MAEYLTWKCSGKFYGVVWGAEFEATITEAKEIAVEESKETGAVVTVSFLSQGILCHIAPTTDLSRIKRDWKKARPGTEVGPYPAR